MHMIGDLNHWKRLFDGFAAVRRKGIRARGTGLLHRIGDCPDFINRTNGVSYGPCRCRARLLPRGFGGDLPTHGTVFAFRCAQVGAIAVRNKRKSSVAMSAPTLPEFDPSNSDQSARRGAAHRG